MKVTIKKAKSDTVGAIWLIVDRDDSVHSTADDLQESLDIETIGENTAYAFKEDELEPIYEALKEYLKKVDVDELIEIAHKDLNKNDWMPMLKDWLVLQKVEREK